MKYDVIVIGGGLGGLTAGARLAKEGKRVLLLEQHDRVGGCATTFKRGRYTMEVGLHEMDGLHTGDMKNRIFNDLGIFDRVKFLELPEFYRFINNRYDVVIPHDADEAIEILSKLFPSETVGIKIYFQHLLNARKIISAPGAAPDRSTGEWLDEIISNDDLKLILLGNLGYFHDDPYSLSYYYYITAQGSYYRGRANFIHGGSQVLSNALADIIRENGGKVLLETKVTSILFEGEEARAVEYIQGGKQTAEIAYATDIVVNSALPSLVEDLLPVTISPAIRESISALRPGASLLTVYYGFKKPLKELGNRNYSIFVYDDSVLGQADIIRNNRSDFDTRSFTFVDYSQVDSGLAPSGGSVGAVCCIDYPATWEKLSRDEYRSRKKEVIEIFNGRLEKIIPGFTDNVDFAEVGTSLTVKRYTLNTGGAVYGFAQTPARDNSWTNLLPSNIHIASAWGPLGGGFSGAIMGGYMAALGIIRGQRGR